jgi:hypothetical protein
VLLIRPSSRGAHRQEVLPAERKKNFMNHGSELKPSEKIRGVESVYAWLRNNMKGIYATTMVGHPNISMVTA